MSVDLPHQPELTYLTERAEDAPLAWALIDRAFGPGRFTKASERVREFAAFQPELSYCAWSEGRLIGVVHMYLVRVGERPVVFLGPLAVEAGARKLGAGQGLVDHACRAAEAAGHVAVLLVGDPPFFARAGFSAAPAAQVVMPGPVDQRRVLVRVLRPGGDAGLSGPVRAPA